MANSRFAYVKKFEIPEVLLPNTFISVRIDGICFSKFVKVHAYEKPNDIRGLDLMNSAALTVQKNLSDVVLCYGHSDEFSFVFRRSTKLYNRRKEKLQSHVLSLFTSAFVRDWGTFFPETPLEYPPCFDARVVLYPTLKNLRDYLSWRQADCHINTMYNLCFWKLVKEKGLSHQEAESRLKGTLSKDKNELLFQEFGLNYNNVPEIFRKGSVALRRGVPASAKKQKLECVLLHIDIIGEEFWKTHASLFE